MPVPLNFPVPGFIPLALFDMLGLAAMGAPFMALACEIAGRTSRKVFLDKLAMQMAGMGVWAGLMSLAGSVACLFLGLSRFPAMRAEWRGYQSEISAIAVAGAVFFIFLLFYRLSWKALKKAKGLHMALGVLSGLGSISLIGVVGLGMRSASAVFLSGDKAPLGLFGALDAPGYSLMWPVLAACLGWCLSYGGAMSMVYLILRRNRDDFGRDYYTFAMPVASRWAVSGLGVLVVALTWFVSVLPPDLSHTLRGPGAPLYWGGLLGVLVACGVLWSILGGSSKPMRFKGLAVLGAACAWGAHTLAFMILFRMYLES